MKIDTLVITHNADRFDSGYAIRTLAMCSALRRNGFTVGLLRLVPGLHGAASWNTAAKDSVDLLAESKIPPFSRYATMRDISVLYSRRIVKETIARHKPGIVQCEGHSSSMVLPETGSRKFRVIMDFHGATPEEIIYGKKMTRKLENSCDWHRRSEQRAMKESDAIFVVSSEMARHLESRYGKCDRIHVVPIGVNDHFFRPVNRSSARKRLGYRDEIVLCYLGGTASYQCIPEMARFLRRLAASGRVVHWLVITGDSDGFVRAIKGCGEEVPENTKFLSVDNSEVPGHMAAADIGLLFRKENLINTVSCPTKFGEYLACGLPVLATRHAGHSARFIENFGVGHLVDLESPDMERLSKILDVRDPSIRERCRAVAIRELSWEKIGGNVCEIHRRMAGEPAPVS